MCRVRAPGRQVQSILGAHGQADCSAWWLLCCGRGGERQDSQLPPSASCCTVAVRLDGGLAASCLVRARSCLVCQLLDGPSKMLLCRRCCATSAWVTSGALRAGCHRGSPLRRPAS